MQTPLRAKQNPLHRDWLEREKWRERSAAPAKADLWQGQTVSQGLWGSASQSLQT